MIQFIAYQQYIVGNYKVIGTPILQLIIICEIVL